ncbi:MAG: hypothetical protein ACRD1Z_01050, partial [Vicinamibacteria bacterium]
LGYRFKDPAVLSSHPLTEDRIRAVEAKIAGLPSLQGLAIADAYLPGVQNALSTVLASLPPTQGSQATTGSEKSLRPRRRR